MVKVRVNVIVKFINTHTATPPVSAAPHSYQSPASGSYAHGTPSLNREGRGGSLYNSHATSTPHSPGYVQRAAGRTPGSTALFSRSQRYPLVIRITPKRCRKGSNTCSHSCCKRLITSSLGSFLIPSRMAVPLAHISLREKCAVSIRV